MYTTQVERYHRPATLEATLSLLEQLGAEGHVLAGGTELLTVHPRLSDVVDITRLDLDSIQDQAGHFEIGACCTLQTLLDYGEKRLPDPLTQAAQGEMGSLLRNSATVGGLLSGTQSPQDLQTALIALSASVRIQSQKGIEEVAVADFLVARSTLLRPGNLLTHVLVPHQDHAVSRFERCAISSLDTSIASVAVTLTRNEDGTSSAKIAAGNICNHARSLPAAEKAMVQGGREAAVQACVEDLAGFEVRTDVRGSAAYRQHLVTTLLDRCLAGALGAISH